MPDSSDPCRDPRTYLERRFGVPIPTLDALTFVERRDAWWVCTAAPHPGIESNRPPGLRALRHQPGGLKPTSAFLVALGDCIIRSRIDLTIDALRSLLLGHRLKAVIDLTDGYVAVCYQDDVLGCGVVRHGVLRGLIPTGRRRELLACLDRGPAD